MIGGQQNVSQNGHRGQEGTARPAMLNPLRGFPEGKRVSLATSSECCNEWARLTRVYPKVGQSTRIDVIV